MDESSETTNKQSKTTNKRVKELEQVTAEYGELVQILLDHIEGREDEAYSYSFQDGWKEKEQDPEREEFDAEDLDAQLREIRELKQKYQ